MAFENLQPWHRRRSGWFFYSKSLYNDEKVNESDTGAEKRLRDKLHPLTNTRNILMFMIPVKHRKEMTFWTTWGKFHYNYYL